MWRVRTITCSVLYISEVKQCVVARKSGITHATDTAIEHVPMSVQLFLNAGLWRPLLGVCCLQLVSSQTQIQ